jgi:hypothetical protein
MSNRDVIDFVDYDIDPDKWINVLLSQISSNRYEPATPTTFLLGKGNGFSRTMTQPAIPDLVLYRTIVDTIYLRAIRRENAHVYFKRDALKAAQNTAQQQAAQTIGWVSQYQLISHRSFLNWLRYAQYRKHLLLQSVHPFLVLTDVANFFDSVLHSHVEEAVRGLAVSPRLLGLLSFLLERLAVRRDYAASHAISLPVDQFDCSRTLAHITLFSHDDRMVKCVGIDNYVRWMDDQNIGVDSRSAGLLALAEVGKSLAKLHLYPNPKKSKILPLRDAKRHFHLDLNDLLDKAEAAAKLAKSTKQMRAVSKQLTNIWSRARPYEGVGEFDKVLKRLYSLAGFSKLRFLRHRATRDLISNPDLARKVCDYMRCSGTASEFISWAETLMTNSEQVYSDISVTLLESLLRLEPDVAQTRRLRALAVEFLSGRRDIPGKSECRAIAPLLLLRFGDRRSLPLLRRCFDDDKAAAHPSLLRSAAITYASYGKDELTAVRKAASRRLVNHLADVVRLIERIKKVDAVPNRYKSRLNIRYDSVSKGHYMDMRALLTVRLLNMARSKNVTDWVDQWKTKTLAKSISTYDQKLIRRLL